MTVEQLEKLVASGESETLEFKETTGRRREAMHTICAMLNQHGGHVLFGVTNSGEIKGQHVGTQTIEDVSQEIQRIDPPVFPSVERVRLINGREVVAVRITRSSMRPYQFRGSSYLRVGNTTVRMDADQFSRMLFERMHTEKRWETQPAHGWSVDDLDASEIRNTVAAAIDRGRLNAPVGRSTSDYLRGLGLIENGTLLRAAVVLFGKAERLQVSYPQCEIRAARFRGLDKSDFLDNRQFHGNAFSLLASAERFLREHVPVRSYFDPGQMERIDVPRYPPLATREALANALCHRDYGMGGGSIGLAMYDDRLEVESLGPLRFGLTPLDLLKPHVSRPWNPLVARTFYRRGVIEKWGSGTLKMAGLVVGAGLMPPEIEEVNDWVTVRFRRVDYAYSANDRDAQARPRQLVLSSLIASAEGLPLREIAVRLAPAVSARQVKRALEKLRDSGQAKVHGHGLAARWIWTGHGEN